MLFWTLSYGKHRLVLDKTVHKGNNIIQQQRLGGGITKHAQILEAVVGDIEGSIKDRSNSTGLGRNAQGGGAVGVTIWKRELCSDQ